MKCPECEIFQTGSRKWEICRGESELSEQKTDAYRKKWGLPPLFPVATPPSADPEPLKIPELVFHGTSVDAGERRHKLYGPGSELLKIYEAAGVPHCDACRELAQEMNNWGVQECRSRIDEIVADILPRAKAWLAENRPWMTRLIPDAVEEFAIVVKLKQDVERAIAAAESTIADRRRKRLDIYTGKKKTRNGCKSCGKNRSLKIPRLVRSTVRQRQPRPFTGPVKKNLLCHCWPNGDNWRKHVEYLRPVSNDFERKIMAVAMGPGTASLADVKQAFGPSWEYLEFVNNPKRREVLTYPKMFELIESVDENEVTFCIHTKGTQERTARQQQIAFWIQAMYATLIYDWKNVLAEFEKGYAIAGPFRRHGAHFRTRYNWHYSGTFYAFRNAVAFSDGIPEFDERWWGTESWPGHHFSKTESCCLFHDHCGDLYKRNLKLEQEFEKWRSERGVLYP